MNMLMFLIYFYHLTFTLILTTFLNQANQMFLLSVPLTIATSIYNSDAIYTLYLPPPHSVAHNRRLIPILLSSLSKHCFSSSLVNSHIHNDSTTQELSSRCHTCLKKYQLLTFSLSEKNTLKLASSLLDDRNFNSMEKCIQFSKHSIFPAFSCYFAFLGTNNATALHTTW